MHDECIKFNSPEKIGTEPEDIWIQSRLSKLISEVTNIEIPESADLKEFDDVIKEKTIHCPKCNDELDFLYGYYVGKIEEGSLHYLLKATRASAGGYVDTFEIRGIIEENKNELQDTIKSVLN